MQNLVKYKVIFRLLKSKISKNCLYKKINNRLSNQILKI